jgi:cytochrome c biogenesis protein CcmG, thiol:disulfide interchange protein DsbE
VKHPARIAALAVALVVVVFGVVLALNVGSDPQEDAQQSHLVGKAAPAIDLPDLTGGRVTLADVAGKSAIVNFWNSWCTPCQEEEPALKRFYAAHKDDPDFAMIGIVRNDETDTVKAYVKQNGIEWTVALDPKNVAALDFGTRGQPETYAISPSGVVAAAKYGAMSPKELELFLTAARRSA